MSPSFPIGALFSNEFKTPNKLAQPTRLRAVDDESLGKDMTPKGPCFEVGPNGYFEFSPQYESTRLWTTLGAFSGFAEKCFVFDGSGRKWKAHSVQAPFKKSWWRVLLAKTVYNPQISVTVLWHAAPSEYKLDELKLAYLDAVDKDDDILTQFVEADELKRKIADAQRFESLAEVYRWMQTDRLSEKTA